MPPCQKVSPPPDGLIVTLSTSLPSMRATVACPASWTSVTSQRSGRRGQVSEKSSHTVALTLAATTSARRSIGAAAGVGARSIAPCCLVADDPRRPVLVGVGVADQPASSSEIGRDALDLMVDAVRAAAADACSTSILAAVDSVAVPRGTWSYSDPARLIAARIGAEARTIVAEVGVPQQTLISDALTRISSGQSEAVLIVGGEARRRAATAAKGGLPAPETADPGATPDLLLAPTEEIVSGPEVLAGLAEPVRQYAIIDNALRYAEHQSLDEHRAELARLWAGFSAVAATNPRAAFPSP